MLDGAVNAACESAFGALESAGGSVSDCSSSEASFVKPCDACMSEPSLSQNRGTAELLSSEESHRCRSHNRKSSHVAGPCSIWRFCSC